MLQLECGVLAHVGNVRHGVRARTRVFVIDLRVVVSVQDARHAGEARHVRGRHQQPPSLLENAAALEQHVHRIVNQVFDHLAGEHGLEVPVVVREPVALGVEQVHAAFEDLAAHARGLLFGSPQRASMRLHAKPLDKLADHYIDMSPGLRRDILLSTTPQRSDLDQDWRERVGPVTQGAQLP